MLAKLRRLRKSRSFGGGLTNYLKPFLLYFIMTKMNYSQFLKKHKLKEGALIQVIGDKESYEGYIIPSKDPALLVLKLKTGYNVGIDLKKIKGVKRLAEEKYVGKAKLIKVERNSALPDISILHTGGTIASRVDYRTGAVFSSFTPEDLITMFPELGGIANFDSKLISNMFSENMRFAHYKKIAEAIKKEVKKDIAGIILPHGTDTMHYTAAVLAFMLENLPIPVILVGAQRSTDRGSSDAAINLICAAEFITKSDFAGVAICMHESSADDSCVILPPCKTRKLHTSRRDAFQAVNDTPIARVNFKTREVEFIKKDYPKRDSSKELVVRDKIEEKVALIKSFPNIMPEQIDFFRKHKYKGVVFEGTGMGQLPVGVENPLSKINAKNMKAVKALCKSGCVVVMTSQCIFGRVQMHVYSAAVDLVNLGVVPGEDMLPETAFIKLAWLLGNYPKEKARELIGKNLRGEITPCTRIDSFDLK